MIDEKLIVKRLKEGDTEAFSLLLDLYGSRVFSSIVRVVGNREDAEELTQDVFLKVHNSIGRYRGESSLSTWIYRIAYNTAVSKVRKTGKGPPMLDDTILERRCVEEPVADTDDKLSSLERALTFLPAEESMIIQLFYNEDKNVDELSSITGLTASNVKVKLHRIRKKLYLYLRESHEKER